MKPILFSTPMVQAILKGQKTQTRRVVKDPYVVGLLEMEQPYNALTLCRHRKGDILWVRETFRPKSHGMPIGDPYEYRATALEDGNPTDEPWKPSIFMPKEACRIFLAVTNVRVERLQTISEADARAEGVDSVDSFFALWQKLNGTESLADNPWVWVYEFEVTNSPENQNRDKAIIGYGPALKCRCEMPAKMHGKNLCWRCKRPLF